MSEVLATPDFEEFMWLAERLEPRLERFDRSHPIAAPLYDAVNNVIGPLEISLEALAL